MTTRLGFEAILKFSAGFALVAVLLFLPAGTVDYPGGWLLISILFIPMFLAGLVMMAKDPNLLRSRLNAREQQKDQDLPLWGPERRHRAGGQPQRPPAGDRARGGL